MHKNYLQYSYLTYSSLKAMHIDTFSTPSITKMDE